MDKRGTLTEKPSSMVYNFSSSNWFNNMSWDIDYIYSINIDDWVDDWMDSFNKLISNMISRRTNNWS